MSFRNLIIDRLGFFVITSVFSGRLLKTTGVRNPVRGIVKLEGKGAGGTVFKGIKLWGTSLDARQTLANGYKLRSIKIVKRAMYVKLYRVIEGLGRGIFME